MSQFRADLHIHSRYSRATSKGLTPRHLAAWARVKGLTLLGTGDFTHPGWLAELKEQLVSDGKGLLKLASDTGLSKEIPWLSGFLPQGRVRFMLQAEISSIYSRGGRVRKVHNLVYVPSFEAAERLNAKLAKVGNLGSDGRPILGLDSRHLLEMVLETDFLAFLVPAHIWTPWFSVFGAKSGFDTLEECFGDLSSHIFALETGLSSDPQMNWLWSALDRYRLISNSDAHSGANLGRECNLFEGELTYETVVRSLRGQGVGQKFLGSVEFFPEEGKYHLDGHRKCNVVLSPEETRARGGLCPVCGKPLTMGVLHRVLELADRPRPVKPAGQPGFTSLIPLPELVSEILGCGADTKKARNLYRKVLSQVGSEMQVLMEAQPADIAAVSPPLAEAVARMRKGQVRRRSGYDGEYGRITVFSEAELREIQGGKLLFQLPTPPAKERPDLPLLAPDPAESSPPPAASGLNPSQERAAAAGPGPVLVLAGPGTGKTHTLLARILRLVEAGTDPRRILAVTFTRRAADELQERLARRFDPGASLPTADTLHALAFAYWSQAYAEAPVIMREEAAYQVFTEVTPELTTARRKALWQEMQLAREGLTMTEALKAKVRPYVKQRESWNLVDYTDLLEHFLEQIEARIYRHDFDHILVDEIQDFSPLQLAVVKALVGTTGQGFFAIGDPEQSIYAFRGAAEDVRANLATTWPQLQVVRLEANYRSTPRILELAGQLAPKAGVLTAAGHDDGSGEVQIFTAADGQAEAAWIAGRLAKLLGGSSLTLHDGEAPDLSPGDVAVLVRLKALIPPIEKALAKAGLPVSVPEAEAFWLEPRLAALIKAASRFVGMRGEDPEALDIPEGILFQGPARLDAHLGETPPFDRMFWKSKEYKAFSRAFADHGSWVGLIDWINLQTELELAGQRAEKIRIMTLHAAKGLEFQAVCLAGLEDGILPLAGMGFLTGKVDQGENVPDPAEEQRLFYVGLTRARRWLYLSCARQRQLFGREMRLKPSRFLALLPQELAARSAMVARKVRQEEQLRLL